MKCGGVMVKMMKGSAECAKAGNRAVVRKQTKRASARHGDWPAENFLNESIDKEVYNE
jgi:hypothetical protein